MRNQLNIKLAEAQLTQLRDLAASLGLSASELARVAIGEYLLNHQKGSVEMESKKTLRDYLKEFYADLLDGVLAQEPEAAPDLDEPVTEIWQCQERMGGVSTALHAGSTIWVNTPTSHITTNDDDLSEYEDPAQWRRIYPTLENQVYERQGEWGGYTITKAPTGFVVSTWSARQGELTDAKYLLPYGKAAGGYGKDADLNASHNEGMTVGDYLYNIATETEGVRVLRKGRIVQ